MEQKQVEKFKNWFDQYTAGFYGDDEFVNANIKLKKDHSKRTCEEIVDLADELGLGSDQKRLAEVTALFHDVGRFRQFIRYRTYNDPRSVNHCLLGLEVLLETKIFEDLEPKEREVIEKSIEYHGLKKLPADLNGDCLLFSKLLRDADKLDIFYVVTEYYAQYREDPDSFKLEVELPDEPWYSPEVLEAILAQERIDYNKLKTWNDMKLLQLGWVYDVNFAATLKRIRQRGLLEKIVEFLPDTEDIKKVKERVLGYVDSRIASGI